jgi:pyruvate kinase
MCDMRETKIVCTIGPATANETMIRELLVAGMDVARLNFSHGEQEQHRQAVELLRREAKSLGRELAIFADLQGPKIRTNDFDGGEITVENHEEIRLIHSQDNGRAGLITTKFFPLVRDTNVGDRILLNDGLVELKVVAKDSSSLTCTVVKGGLLKNRRGINLPGVKLDVPAMTEKDLSDAQFALGLDIDFIALSFVRRAADIVLLRELIEKAGRSNEIQVIAKIEKPEAVEDISEILKVVQVLMIARGDLGVELGIEKVPGVQKRIIREAIRHGVPVITATQMLESMIQNPWPTRAEASDVANAVFDGTDAIMLSGETAVGKYPIETVRIVRNILVEAEHQTFGNGGGEWQILDSSSSRLGMSLGKAAHLFAQQMGAKAMACLSDTGGAAIRLTAQRPKIPVFMFSEHLAAVRRMALVRSAHGLLLDEALEPGEVFPRMEALLLKKGLIRKGDAVVYTAGISLKRSVSTNTIHIRTTDECEVDA